MWTPGTRSLDEEGAARGARGPRRRRGVAVATAVVPLVLGLAACGEDDGSAAPSASPTPSSTTASASPSESSSPTVTVSDTPNSTASTTASTTPSPTSSGKPTPSAVYFLEDTRAGLRLARETRELPGADPAKEAVEAMIAGAEDPDYSTTWNPRTRVRSVSRRGPVIEVDLSRAARTANVGSEGAARMVQQLVYTVTEAVDPRAKVRLLVEGEPAGELWGAVTWERPVGRADPAQVRVLVQIDTPRDGATARSPLVVSGEANAFEATVLWRVLDGTGKGVKRGFTTAAEGMTFSPYSFRVRLPPGHYTVEVSEDDPSGGEGGQPMTDTKHVTVR